MATGSHGKRCVLPQIKSRDSRGSFRFPVTNPKFTVFMFVEFRAGGDETKLARPPDGQFIGGKIRGIAQMRVPAFPGADEQDAVSCIFNHVAVVVKLEREFLILWRNLREDDIQKVVSAPAALLQGHALVLKKLQRVAVLARHAIYRQSARQLKHQDTRFAGFRANLDGCRCVERVVRENRWLEGVVESAESRNRNRKIRNAMRCPRVVKSSGVVFYGLSEKELLVAQAIDNNVEWACGSTVKVCVKSGPRVR